MKKLNQKGFHVVEALIILVVIALIVLAGWKVMHRSSHYKQGDSGIGGNKLETSGGVTYDKTTSDQLTGGHCSGAGSVKIVPPMKLDQVSFILPYGLMVGGHVTPVDHQYYNGLDVHAVRDTYDVVAPADGTIVSIQHRGDKFNTPAHSVDVPSSDEYRFVFTHTCSFLTYVDLVTSIDSSIKSQLPSQFSSQNTNMSVQIKVKQGQVIGHIGGQTLDFAVWDLSRPLKGFINPKAYTNAEVWKPFTAPPSEYFESSIKAKTIAKYIRTIAPIDGKIDYDKAGKLIGTWFKESTNGYAGGDRPGTPGYWAGHLSIVPDYLDPSTYVVSTGTFASQFSVNTNLNDPGSKEGSSATQFWLEKDIKDPAKVDSGSGMIKYVLHHQDRYLKTSGGEWDSSSLTHDPKANPGQIEGVLLVQLIDNNKLKVQFFPGKSAGQVIGFTSDSLIYTRGEDAHVVQSNTAH